MLEEYSVRSSDATIDIVYSDFSGSSRDSDLVSITNVIHNNDSNNDSNNDPNNDSNNDSNNESNNFYKKIIIFCILILFVSALYLISIY